MGVHGCLNANVGAETGVVPQIDPSIDGKLEEPCAVCRGDVAEVGSGGLSSRIQRETEQPTGPLRQDGTAGRASTVRRERRRLPQLAAMTPDGLWV